MIKLCGDGDGRGRLGRLLLLKPPREGELLLLFRSTPPPLRGEGEKWPIESFGKLAIYGFVGTWAGQNAYGRPPNAHGLGKAGMLAQKREREEREVIVTMGIKRAASTVVKCALIMTLVELEAADNLARQQRLMWGRSFFDFSIFNQLRSSPNFVGLMPWPCSKMSTFKSAASNFLRNPSNQQSQFTSLRGSAFLF